MERLVSVLCTAFGLIATIPAGIGLYGIMAFHVAGRTKENGIGIALGVQRSDVHRLIMKEAGILAIAGVAIGIHDHSLQHEPHIANRTDEPNDLYRRRALPAAYRLDSHPAAGDSDAHDSIATADAPFRLRLSIGAMKK